MKPVIPVEHKLGTLPGSYREMAKAFVEFAVTKQGPIYGPGLGNSVYFLGTYWDDPPGNNSEEIIVESSILFVNPVIAVISAEEHSDEFPSNPPIQVLLGRAEEIINDTDTEVSITDPNGETSDFSLGQLQRIQSSRREKHSLKVGTNVWPKYSRGGVVYACWDGYFLGFESLDAGKYTIKMDSDSPYFGRPGHRYRSSFRYDMTVKT